jgi:putative metallohydrolase (TIGR04338 family)
MVYHGWMARDTQRKKIYDSEDAVFPGHKKGPHEDLRTVTDVERFLHDVVRRKYVQRRYPNAVRYASVGIQVSDGRGTRWARGGGGYINAPLWARTKTVLLHELAHNLAGTSAEHNWQFAECYLFLVRVMLGKDAADKLEAEYKQRRVRYRAPRAKREVSPERRAALVNQLTAARAAKQGTTMDWIDWTKV